MLKVKEGILFGIFVIFYLNLHLIYCSPIDDQRLARDEAKKSNSAFSSIPYKSKDYGTPFKIGSSIPSSHYTDEIKRMRITGITYSGVTKNENYNVYRTVAETEDKRGTHSCNLRITTIERDNDYTSAYECSKKKQ